MSSTAALAAKIFAKNFAKSFFKGQIKQAITPTYVSGGSTKCIHCDCFIDNDQYYAVEKFSKVSRCALIFKCEKCGHFILEHKLFL